MHFYVYVIAFDQDVFGIFATREEAEKNLERQIEEGGPAWDACKVERWKVNGTPEVTRPDQHSP
jgi:hypothetical protein